MSTELELVYVHKKTGELITMLVKPGYVSITTESIKLLCEDTTLSEFMEVAGFSSDYDLVGVLN
jgi:hypothetical protein